MANLQKMKKEDLIKLCNERGSEIAANRKQISELKSLFSTANKAVAETKRQCDTLKKDFEEREKSYKERISDMNTMHVEEIQNLEGKITDKDEAIQMQLKSYRDLADDYDKLVYENGINKSNVAKYKLAAIAAVIAFLIALIWACL